MKPEPPDDERDVARAAREAVAKIDAAASFLQSPYLQARLIEGMQLAMVRVHSPWMTRQDAAEYARCSASEIDRVANLGVIVRHMRGGTPLFKRAEIDEAIENNKWPSMKGMTK
jgi:hypothetical protein